jgi:TniQ
MTVPGQPRPLPVRPRPRPGETTGTYIERLARANHLPARHLRRYLCAPPGHTGRPALSRLAAVSGRTETALRHAMADLTCGHCSTPLTIPAGGGRPTRWCSSICALRAFRQRKRGEPERRDPARTPAANCRHCGTPITRKHQGRPARWCSTICALRAYRQRIKRNQQPGPAR